MEGWVKIHRKLCENELWLLEPFTKGQAWVDLFLNANHKENIINIRGNILTIERGQLGWSELTMCRRWRWSKNKTRRFLKWLETKQQIEQQKSSLTTIITILNYDSYQLEEQQTIQQTIQQKDSRRYTNKNDKNDKNVKKNTNTLQPYGCGKEIAELIYLFKPVNPTINYGNKTQRKSIEELLKLFDYEKLKSMIEITVKHQGKEFMPTITTPWQFKEKLGAIKIYFERLKNNNNKFKITSL